MKLPKALNLKDIQAESDFVLVQAGNYRVKGSKCEPSQDKKSLELSLTILDGEYQGCTITDKIGLFSDNEKQVKFSLSRVRRLLDLSGKGVTTLSDTDQLIGFEMVVSVIVEEYTKNDGAMGRSNKIKKYFPAEVNTYADLSKPAEPAKQSSAPWEQSASLDTSDIPF